MDLAGNSDQPMQEEGSPFLRRIYIENYKSIQAANVYLGPLTILVGRNGSGKSNFLDALRFIADGLQTSFVHAVTSRGGISELRGRLRPDRGFSIELDIALPDGQSAVYGLVADSGPVIRREFLTVLSSSRAISHYYYVDNGQVLGQSIANLPPASIDRLYLITASGFSEFRACYDALSTMSFYNLNPDSIKDFQVPAARGILNRDGGNLASVVGRLIADCPEVMIRIVEYLAAIVPGVLDVRSIPLGPRETLQFTQRFGSSQEDFLAWSMSDGTLRTLGTLVAVHQRTDSGSPVSLVGIEEPETALHPAAVGALMDSLREAAARTQVLVTSHSPDLLDNVDLHTDHLLAVVSYEGRTQIAPIDEASREAIRRHLYTPGELLRLDQLEPDRRDLERQGRSVPSSFEEKA